MAAPPPASPPSFYVRTFTGLASHRVVVKKQLRNRKRRLQHRLRRRQWQEHKRRLFQDQNIHYDYSEKTRAGRFGGLGVCRLLIQRLGLADAIDDNLHLLKRHLPYHGSHIINWL